MPTRFIPGNEAENWVDGVDRNYYENQVANAGHSPFDETYEFRLAAARAKDHARHKMIRAIQNENERLLTDRNRFVELGDVLAGGGTAIGDRTAQATANVKRSINGVEGAPNDAIKL